MVAKIQERRYNVATAFLLVVREIGCIAVRCASTGRRFLLFKCFNLVEFDLFKYQVKVILNNVTKINHKSVFRVGVKGFIC